MALKFATIALGLLQLTTALPTNPANILEDLLMIDDTVSVGSYVRETRAAAVSWDMINFLWAGNQNPKKTYFLMRCCFFDYYTNLILYHSQPDDWHKTVQNEGDGEIGYSRKKTGGGKKGYQHFDSFHKKAGDNYEFEKQDSYGQEEKGQDGAYSNNYEKLGKSKMLMI